MEDSPLFPMQSWNEQSLIGCRTHVDEYAVSQGKTVLIYEGYTGSRVFEWFFLCFPEIFHDDSCDMSLLKANLNF